MLKQSFSLIVCFSLASVNILANNEDENNKPSSHFPISITTACLITGMASGVYMSLTTEGNLGPTIFGLSSLFAYLEHLGNTYKDLGEKHDAKRLKDYYDLEVTLQERLLARKEEIRQNRASTKQQVPQE